MSELKDYDIMDIEAMDDERLEKSESGKIQVTRVYIKSEADKVIADLEESNKMEVEQLLILNREQANAANRLRDSMERVIRHNKYKRCLAMAKWCRESLRLMRTYEVTEDYWNLEPGQDAEYFCKKGDFYSKWRKRWLELAEKFKEGV